MENAKNEDVGASLAFIFRHLPFLPPIAINVIDK